MSNIDERVKTIMGLKKVVGEFSLDLYYNDLSHDTPYVAKLHSAMDKSLDYHARAESFDNALTEIEFFMQGWIYGIRRK